MKERQIATCVGKQKFTDIATATRAVKSERLRRSGAHAYRCHVCHEWHVGTQFKRRGGRPRQPEDGDDEAYP